MTQIFIACFLLAGAMCNVLSPSLKFHTYHEEDSSVSELTLEGQPDDTHMLQFTAFGQRYLINLEPANSIFGPDFKIMHSSNSTIVDVIEDSDGGNFYTDKNHVGSYYIRKIENEIRVDGIVDDQIRIWHENGIHKAHRVSNKYLNDAFSHDYISQPTVYQAGKNWVFPEELPPLPEVVTVEVYTLLDVILYNTLKEKELPVKKYIGLLWNYVQSKYKSTKNPRIEFSVVYTSVLTEKDWITSTIVEKTQPPTVNSHAMIENLGKWLYKMADDPTMPTYDIAIMHTGLNLASPTSWPGFFSNGNLGVAFFEGVCKIDELNKTMMNVGLMEDLEVSLKFEGVITVAHEVAHLLGAPHDNEEPKNKKCPDNYIMYYALGPDTIEQFSKCSLKSMNQHLSKQESSCIRNQVSPGTTAPIATINIPSDHISADEVCKRCFGVNSKAAAPIFQGSEDPCENLYCQVSENKAVSLGKPSPDGMICGEDKICKDYVCEDEFKPCP